MAKRNYLVGWDIGRTGSMKVTLTASTGGHGADDISISSGTYCHVALSSVTGGSTYASFATTIQTAFNALGGGRPTLTVAFSAVTLQYTFSVSSGTLAISFSGSEGTRARQVLGFSGNVAATGSPISTDYRPYYAIRSKVGEVSNFTDEKEDPDAVKRTVADDATPYSISRSTVPKFTQWDQMMEEKVAPSTHLSGGEASGGAGVFTYSPCPTTEVPWTWEHFVQHARGDIPFALYDDSASSGLVCYLRDESDTFDQSRSMDHYDGLFNIPIKVQLRGRL